jgi:hypothetical protein
MTTTVQTYQKIIVTRQDYDGEGSSGPAESSTLEGIAKQIASGDNGASAKGFTATTSDYAKIDGREYIAVGGPSKRETCYFGRPATAADIAKCDQATQDYVEMCAKVDLKTSFFVGRDGKVYPANKGDVVISLDTMAKSVISQSAKEMMAI